MDKNELMKLRKAHKAYSFMSDEEFEERVLGDKYLPAFLGVKNAPVYEKAIENVRNDIIRGNLTSSALFSLVDTMYLQNIYNVKTFDGERTKEREFRLSILETIVKLFGGSLTPKKVGDKVRRAMKENSQLYYRVFHGDGGEIETEIPRTIVIPMNKDNVFNTTVKLLGGIR